MPIDNVRFGEGVKIHHTDLVNLYGCEIGENTQIGPFVEIQKGVKVGKNCTISSHTFICEGVTIEDDVFIGHDVMFVNEKHPQPNRPGWELPPENAILVKWGASIGTGTVIMPGVTIGKRAEIGAGALVLRDVLDYTVVVTKSQQITLYYKDLKWGWSMAKGHNEKS